MTAVDRSITIERVRVVSCAVADHVPAPLLVTGYLGTGAAAPPHDQRIVIRELHVGVEAELDAAAARQLGQQLAWRVADQLAELQDRRSAGELPPGPIHIESARVHLRGQIARHPPSHVISAALMNALEQKVRDV